MIRKPVFKTVELVNLPQIDPGTYAFTFNTSVTAGGLTFVFKWLNSSWNGWATLPSGEVREFGCVPYVINWTGFADFGVVVGNPKTSLGQDDLSGSSLYWITWEP